jgi:hypothetical protein
MEHATDKNLDGRCQEQVNNTPRNTIMGILMDPGVGEIGGGPHMVSFLLCTQAVLNHMDDQGTSMGAAHGFSLWHIGS